MHRALRLRAVRAGDDGLVLAARAGDEHLGADGQPFLHGGVVATLLDTAATFALIAASGVDWSTVDLRLDYLRPVPAGELETRSHVVHAGRRLGRARAELVVPGTDRVLAAAAGTFTRSAAESGTQPS